MKTEREYEEPTTLGIPLSLKLAVKDAAQDKGISMKQFILNVLSEAVRAQKQ